MGDGTSYVSVSRVIRVNADLSVHAPIPVFTPRRSRRSRADPGVHVPAIRAFTPAIPAFTSRRSRRSHAGDLGVHERPRSAGYREDDDARSRLWEKEPQALLFSTQLLATHGLNAEPIELRDDTQHYATTVWLADWARCRPCACTRTRDGALVGHAGVHGHRVHAWLDALRLGVGGDTLSVWEVRDA